jgi:hypothetical protein
MNLLTEEADTAASGNEDVTASRLTHMNNICYQTSNSDQANYHSKLNERILQKFILH